jgi:hypothetical protein
MITFIIQLIANSLHSAQLHSILDNVYVYVQIQQTVLIPQYLRSLCLNWNVFM